jgi:hypothetical protein
MARRDSTKSEQRAAAGYPRGVDETLPSDWIVAAPPEAPGVAAAGRAGARLLFTGAGLAWLTDLARLRALVADGADLALCSRSARDAGLTAETTPPAVRWSSVATWLAQRGGRPFGVLLP